MHALESAAPSPRNATKPFQGTVIAGARNSVKNRDPTSTPPGHKDPTCYFM